MYGKCSESGATQKEKVPSVPHVASLQGSRATQRITKLADGDISATPR